MTDHDAPRPDPPSLRAFLRQARDQAAERRARVLKHPDLAARLTQQPLNYGTPQAWNGYVPHSRNPDGSTNRSPRRAALVDICAEAMRREQEQHQANSTPPETV